MRKRFLLCFIAVIVCCAVLTGCTGSVRIGGKRFPIDSESISAPLKSGETEKLSSFTSLRSADFSGSVSYDEIVAWAEANPDVAVSYTVEFPDGTLVKSSEERADLSALDDDGLDETSRLLEYLPELKTVKLGQISRDAFISFASSHRSVTFEYGLSFMGKDFSSAVRSLDLTGIKHSDIEGLLVLLPCMGSLKDVDLGGEDSSKISWEDIAALQAARPDVDFCYSFTLFEKSFTTLDTAMDLNHTPMSDEGAAVRQVLPCMTKLTYLDMDFCGVSNETMAQIRDDYPDVDVVWRIWFGTAYSVRTDVIKILASKPSMSGHLHNEDVEVLKYCTKVKYLDLGHNGDGETGITDISFVSYMPDLEVFIIAMNSVEDISPLADCPKLEYLEIFSTPISDLSPLANSKALRHLRIEYMPNLTDISPLYGLTELERLWLDWHTPVPAEQIAKMQECAPNCEIDTNGSSRWTIIGLNTETWVYTLHPRYKLLRQQFGYDTLDYSFYWLDPKY